MPQTVTFSSLHTALNDLSPELNSTWNEKSLSFKIKINIGRQQGNCLETMGKR